MKNPRSNLSFQFGRYKFFLIGKIRKLLIFPIRLLRAFDSKLWEINSRDYASSLKLQNTRIKTSTKYDMSAEPGEDYYAIQYLSRLETYLESAGKINCIADFGCGQGRLAIPLAKKFPKAAVVGIDLSFEALKIANLTADNFALENIKFIQSEIGNHVVPITESSIDLAIFTEVAFYLPDWKAILEQIVAKLSPGGILMASFRSTYFTLMLQLRARNFQSASQILNSEFGRVTPEDDLVFTWVNSSELKNFCEEQGLQLLDLFGIGTSSGIQGDMFDDFAQPGLLIKEELSILEKIENTYSRILPDVGRYVTIIAQKPKI